jgi:glycosyltransferase involved in cell wall biosynthesis
MAAYVEGLIDGLLAVGRPTTAFVQDDAAARRLSLRHPGADVDVLAPSSLGAAMDPGSWFVSTSLFLGPTSYDPVPSFVTQARLPVAGVVFDVIPYRHPAAYQQRRSVAARYRLRAGLARSLDVLLAISRFTAATAATELGVGDADVDIIGAGVAPRFSPGPPDLTLLRRHGVRAGRDVVAVTGGDERKNTRRLLLAWAQLPSELREHHRLTLVGATAPVVFDRWRRWRTEAGLSEREVHFAESVSDDAMVAFLRAAALAVLPSTDEGFGLPVAEAAACGCPVICSDAASLPEVLDEPAALFDPLDPASISTAIARALTDQDHRDVLRRAGERARGRWTWPETAQQLCDALAQRPRTGTPGVPAPAVVLVGPGGEVATGVGSYDERTIAALRRVHPDRRVRHAVDLGGMPDVPLVGPERFPAPALGQYVPSTSFDHVVSVLGSSHFHADALGVAQRCAAHVWLHEATLVGAVLGLAHLSRSRHWSLEHVRRHLDHHDGAIVGALGLEDDALVDAVRLHAAGIRFLGHAIACARSVIVSTPLAADIVRSHGGAGLPILVLPHAYEELRPVARPGHDVVAGGSLTADKQPLLAVDAFATVAATLPADARLVFAGAGAADVVTMVDERAAEHGIAERVLVSGRLDHQAYDEQLASARVGLVLRRSYHGEQSGVVADLVRRGVPIVTSLPVPGRPGPDVRTIDPDIDPAALGELVRESFDDGFWREASRSALDRAQRWTYDDMARALWEWLDGGHRAGPGIALVGPAGDG